MHQNGVTMKEILRAYKYRLYPDDAQRQYLAKSFGCARYLWNENVANFNLYLKKSDGYDKKFNYLTLINSGDEFLKEVSSSMLQCRQMDFDQTVSQFFSKTRKTKINKPNYKSRKGRQSIRFSGNKIRSKSDIDNGLVVLSKMKKPFRFINHRKFDGEIKNLTISLNSDGKYYISFLVKEQIEPKKFTGRAVGIDLGIKDLLILSTGLKFNHSKHQLEKANRALKKAQKYLSRKSKGSKNREKARLRVARCYDRVTRIKTNYYHNISNYLVSNFDEIYTEDLNVKGMLKNDKLSSSIHEASWSTLVSMIKYKSEWNDRNFHQIGRFFPSSKTCSECGHKLSELKLSVRDWVCPECGTHHDRDLNAARNILQQGQIDCHDEILYSAATAELGIIPVALMKHSSKIERSDATASVGVRIKQAAWLKPSGC